MVKPAVAALAVVAALAAAPADASRATTVRFTVAASGDFLIHSPVWNRALADGNGRYDFSPMFRPVRRLIAGADLALCHVETPLVGGRPSGYPVFRTPRALARAIRATGWDACSTASNHSLDAGQAGVNSTIAALHRMGLRHAGTARGARERRRPPILRVGQVKVAFLAYTALTNGQRLPHPWTLNLARTRRILTAARAARRRGADAVIVNLHWGAEYQHAPTRAQWRLARRLTRSPSISAIVGQHVHVVQPIRFVNGKPVVFGEGNLVSNQTAACCRAATQDGLIALIDFEQGPRGILARRVRYLPTWVSHPSFRVVHARGASRRRTLAVVGRRRNVIPIR